MYYLTKELPGNDLVPRILRNDLQTLLRRNSETDALVGIPVELARQALIWARSIKQHNSRRKNFMLRHQSYETKQEGP